MSSFDKPNVLERLGSALNSSDLSPRAETVGAVDLITAMAYAQTNPNAGEHGPLDAAVIDPRTRLGALLVRINSGGDRLLEGRAALLLEQWVRHQRAFSKRKVKPSSEDMVRRFVRQSLDEWLNPVCQECYGRQLVGLDRGEVTQRRVRCTRCSGRGWVNEKLGETRQGKVPRHRPRLQGESVRRDCIACGGGGWRTFNRVTQRKTEQCSKCKGTGQRLANDSERASALGVEVRVYQRHWERLFNWLAEGLDRLNHTEKRCLQSQLRAGISPP